MADRCVPHADSMDSPGQPTHEQNVPKCFRWYTVQQTRGLLFPRYFKWYNRLEVYYPVSSLCIFYLFIYYYFFISCEHHANSHQSFSPLATTLNSLKTIHSTYSTHFKNVTSFSIFRQSQDISQQLVRRFDLRRRTVTFSDVC